MTSSRKWLSIPKKHRFEAVGVWTWAGSWAAKELTDGLIPDYMLVEWGVRKIIKDHLVSAGLWSEVPQNVLYLKWHEYQPTKAEVEAERSKNREKLRKWRERNRGETEGVTELQTGSEQIGNPAPDPTRPDPTLTTSNEVVKESTAKRGTRLSESWLPTAESVAVVRQAAPDVDAKAEHPAFIDYWIAQPGQKGVKTNWDATWRNWMRRKQTDLTRHKKLTPEQRARQTMTLATDIDLKELSA